MKEIFCHDEKSFAIYNNMSNNSLIEIGNSGREMLLRSFFNFCFVDFAFHWFFVFCFLSKMFFVELAVPRFKIIKKRQFIILAESLKNILEGVSLVKLPAFWLQLDWKKNSSTGIFQLFCLLWGSPTLRNSSKRLPLVVIAIVILLV